MKKILKDLILGSILIAVILTVYLTSYYQSTENGIIVEEDKDFRKYMLPGKGTVEDPYRIENIDFKSDIAITISYTTKVFIIQNCVFSNLESGIDLLHLSNYTYKIQDCLFENIRGIAVSTYDIINGTVEIEDCIFKETNSAIYTDDCKNFMLNNNTFHSTGRVLLVNGYYSFFDYENQYDDERVSITNNTLVDNEGGISIRNIEYVLIEDNYLHNNSHYYNIDTLAPGLSVSGSISLSLVNNTLEDDTIRIEFNDAQYYEDLIIENVTIDGALFVYIKNSNNIEIVEASPYYLFYKCVNITFSNQDLSEDKVIERITMVQCNNISMINNSFDGYDLSFSDCSDILLDNVKTNRGKIYFEFCLDVDLLGVDIDTGILWVFSSSNFEIRDIRVTFSQYGVNEELIHITSSSNIEISNATTIGGRTAVFLYSVSHVLIQDSYFTSLYYHQVFYIMDFEDVNIINNLIELKLDADLVVGDFNEVDIINNNTIVYIS